MHPATSAASDDEFDAVLVLNAGSSSVKFAVVDPATGGRALEGIGERLLTPQARLLVGHGTGLRELPLAAPTHAAVVAAVLDQVRQLSGVRLIGVGHRVVHGGARFTESVLVDDDVLAAITDCSELAPLHNPANLAGIRAAQAALPELPHVAVFDTAFHQTMPEHAYRYAVPEEWYRDHRVRRYGFHGTSHRYVTMRSAELLGRPASELRLVIAHLGNGCSAAAVRDGRSVDTTMGLTPLEGLVMGTRSGDVDPGLFGYLGERLHLDAAAIVHTLNTRSGLTGLSGIGNDVRAIEAAAAAGNERAALALHVFAYRLAKAIAALVVPLGRLDALVFTGGIGEHSAPTRARVLAQLGFLGLATDADANATHGRGTAGVITTGTKPVALVIPTDEELLLACDTAELARAAAPVGVG